MTTITAAAEIEIDRPVLRVFDFVTDMTNDALWRSDITSMSAVDDAPLGVGKIYREKVGLLGAEVRVTALHSSSLMLCHARILFAYCTSRSATALSRRLAVPDSTSASTSTFATSRCCYGPCWSDVSPHRIRYI